MELENLIKEAAETLRGMDALAGVPVIEMDKGNVSNELKIKVAQSKVAVIVSWNGFEPKIQGDTSPTGLFGQTMLIISIFERPITNRVNAGAPTILKMAQAIANALHGAAAEGMDAPLFLKRITPISEFALGNDSSGVTCDVEFLTKASL